MRADSFAGTMTMAFLFGMPACTPAPTQSSAGADSQPSAAPLSQPGTTSAAVTQVGAAVAEPATELRSRARARFGAAHPPQGISIAQAELGRRLFFEKGISADGQIGCVSCHLPERWGADGLARPKGVFGRENPRNAPTVFNAAGQSAQHWRADRESVEDQARRALLGPSSFGLATDTEAAQRLRATPGYAADFVAAFPGDAEPISVKNWGAAIGAYERTLVTPAAFDAWLEGDSSALGARELAGLSAFLDAGCARCHDGPLLGGQKLRKFGVHRDYWERTHSTVVDAGRFEVTHDEQDRSVFKVPGLRNVARTAPYFHDGSVASLREAVVVMAELQLDKALTSESAAQIVAFLEALTGAVPSTFSPPDSGTVR